MPVNLIKVHVSSRFRDAPSVRWRIDQHCGWCCAAVWKPFLGSCSWTVVADLCYVYSRDGSRAERVECLLKVHESQNSKDCIIVCTAKPCSYRDISASWESVQCTCAEFASRSLIALIFFAWRKISSGPAATSNLSWYPLRLRWVKFRPPGRNHMTNRCQRQVGPHQLDRRASLPSLNCSYRWRLRCWKPIHP